MAKRVRAKLEATSSYFVGEKAGINFIIEVVVSCWTVPWVVAGHWAAWPTSWVTRAPPKPPWPPKP